MLRGEPLTLVPELAHGQGRGRRTEQPKRRAVEALDEPEIRRRQLCHLFIECRAEAVGSARQRPFRPP